MAGDLENKRTEHTPCKCFKCVSIDNLISKCPKSTKDNEKHKKQAHLSERGFHVLQKEYNNSVNKNDLNMYASMERMSYNEESRGSSYLFTTYVAFCLATAL